ncbi:MAG: hypothetical protein LKJ13_02780 [Clostridia bacterium]|jgi:hypothetical protein|nr:hypothetical protein [Clostridia bacterium]MCI1998954.1 hypothetical protein [Clostridia bacterium]MCI2013704.1 hypothetical protein [Clostridia bacterium]
MDETIIVIMIKDEHTGFLEKELGSYKVERHDELIYNTYAQEKDGKYIVFMKLTCDRNVEDWEFDAIYDYYDTQTVLAEAESIAEEEDCYNPTWIVTFDFIDNIEKMEQKIQKILDLHYMELKSVYDAISDKRDEY